MKTAFFGRILFGASAVLFGTIALMWHDTDTWQNLHHIWRLPLGAIIGGCLMVAQIAAGIGIQYPRTVRPASFVLCIVYLCFSLTCVYDIITVKNIYEKYGGTFFAYISLFCGAIALNGSTEPNAGRALMLGRLARIGFGLCAISFTLGHALRLGVIARQVPRWIPPSQMFWAILTTIAFALAAMAILINWRAQFALRMLALMVGLFGLLVWVPQLIAQPKEHSSWTECAQTFLISGAAWIVADFKTSFIRQRI